MGKVPSGACLHPSDAWCPLGSPPIRLASEAPRQEKSLSRMSSQLQAQLGSRWFCSSPGRQRGRHEGLHSQADREVESNTTPAKRPGLQPGCRTVGWSALCRDRAHPLSSVRTAARPPDPRQGACRLVPDSSLPSCLCKSMLVLWERHKTNAKKWRFGAPGWLSWPSGRFLVSTQVMISGSWDGAHVGLCTEYESCLGLSLSPSASLPHSHSCSLSLSNKKIKYTKNAGSSPACHLQLHELGLRFLSCCYHYYYLFYQHHKCIYKGPRPR